ALDGSDAAAGGARDAAEQQMDGWIVGMHARRLLGDAARLLEVAARERVFRARHELGQISGERGPLPFRRARVRQHYHAGALEPEERLRDREVRAPALRRAGAAVPYAI